MTRPTIYDVARAAGVSKSLVSLVLRGSPRVGDASRRAIEQAIRELGYRPSRAATDLAARTTRTIAMLVDDYANPWFVDVVHGLHEVLAPDGYRLSVVDAATASPGDDPADGVLSMRADGIVVAMDVPDALAGPHLPSLVIVGTREDAPGRIDSVANDDARGAEMAAEHLIGLGHRRIGQLPATGGAGRARRASFERAAHAAGAVLVSGGREAVATEAAGYAGAMRLLTDEPEVTAVFAANDVMAIGVLGAAKALGRQVPQSLSVIGYDNTALAESTLIDLTTIDDRSLDVGREAAQVLRERIADPAAPRVERTLAPSLVVRGTTAPPR